MFVGTATALAFILAVLSTSISFLVLRKRPRSWVKAVDFIWLPFALVGMYATIYQVSSLQAERSVESALDIVKASAARLPSRHCVSKTNHWSENSSPKISCDEVTYFFDRVNRINIDKPAELEQMRTFSWEDSDVAAAVNAYNISVKNHTNASTGLWRRLFENVQYFGPFLLAVAFGVRISRAIIEFIDERRKEEQQRKEVERAPAPPEIQNGERTGDVPPAAA